MSHKFGSKNGRPCIIVTHQSLNKIRLFYAAYFAAMGLILPFFPLYLDNRGFDATMIGLMAGLIALAKVIAPPWIGHLLDGSSAAATHRFIIIASSLAAFTAFLFGVSDHVVVFAMIVLLFGIFWATILPLTDGLSITVSESDAADYGRLRAWGSIGFVVTTLAGGAWLVGDYIQSFPIVLGLLMLILVFASMGFPMFKPEVQETLEPEKFSTTFYTLLAIAFIIQVSHGAYYGFFSLYLAEAGYSGSQIGIYWAVGVIAEIILMWRCSKQLQRAAPALVFTLCLLLASLRWAGIGITTDPILLTLLQLLHAASFAAFHVTAIAWVKRLSPDSRHAAAQGLFSAAGFGIGSTIGIMGCGLVASAFGYSTAFYLCAVVALLGIPLCLFLRNIKHTQTKTET